MGRTQARRFAERKGFEDALEIGRPDPLHMPEWERVAYDRGFVRGLRAAKRLTGEQPKISITCP